MLGNLFLWLISSVQDCCKDELSMPPELVSIESKKYKDRLATTNILGSFKLSNNPHYSHLKEIFEIVGTRKLRMQNSLDTLSDQ